MPLATHPDNGPMKFLHRDECACFECASDIIIEENDYFVFFSCVNYKHCGFQEIEEKELSEC